ncbi:MAG: hydantoinase B/oxoprolinase family protein [Anaerolineae bacterium]
MTYDPIRLEIFKNLFASIAEEMGETLRRTAYSPNIKERRDFSCALFDEKGTMISQAAHIPVHLGSMPLSVLSAIEQFDFRPGDTIILNDPYHGGTHLPDITLVAPVFVEGRGRPQLFGFAANRAHHADVGGMTPGSMPLSQEIYQEGLIIPPLKLMEEGRLNQGVMDLIMANVRTAGERGGDLRAQIAANERGRARLRELVAKYGQAEVRQYMGELVRYTERMTRDLIAQLPDGTYTFSDVMDDDGVEDRPAQIVVRITIADDQATIDFSGTSSQRRGSINCVYAITLSAVYYVFRSIIGLDVPSNSGCLAPLKIIAPRGSLVNAVPPAAVAGGNVETSQRIVDVLLGALAQACPECVPAASSGTMNNVSIGGYDPFRRRNYAYYETVGGGMGARPTKDGIDGIHTHMTNTMNTPVEALEYTYPFLVTCYKIRSGTGGKGRYRGGDGLRRDIQLLYDAQVTILSDRRKFAPYGLLSGQPGAPGKNILIKGGEEHPLSSKVNLFAQSGDVISIRTPGGGGYGQP